MAEFLLERFRDGDKKVFKALVDKYAEAVFNTAYRFSYNQADAEDITQETFALIARRAGKFKGGPEWAFICTTAVRCSLHMMRSGKRRRERESKFAVERQRDSHAHQELDAEVKEALEKSLSLLPLEMRAPVVLHHIEGLSSREVAQALSVLEGTVRSRISRALAHMRESLLARGFASAGALPPLLGRLPRLKPSAALIGTCKAAITLASASVASKILLGGLPMKKTRAALSVALVVVLSCICGYMLIKRAGTRQAGEKPADTVAQGETASNTHAGERPAASVSRKSDGGKRNGKDQAVPAGQKQAAAQEPVPDYPYQLPEWHVKMKRLLDRRVSLDFSTAPFETVIRELERKIGVRIIISPGIDVDVYERPITIRLENMMARNVLSLLVAQLGDLAYELEPDRICIKSEKDVSSSGPSKAEAVLAEIDQARKVLGYEEQRQEFLKKLPATEPREFDWYGRNCLQAVEEIKTAWSLPLVCASSAMESLKQSDAPQMRWSGNAIEALERVLENANLSYKVTKGSSIRVCTVEESRAEQESRDALERFTSIVLSGKIENEPFHKLIARMQQDTRVSIYPDRASWEAGVVVTVPGENPTAGQVLDCLLKEHKIMHWYEVDGKTGEEKLFLLKSQ